MTCQLPLRDEFAPRAAAGAKRVDVHVVRTVLQMNPAVRAGRTTGEIKKALERGEPLVPAHTSAARAAVSTGALQRSTGAEALTLFARDRLVALDQELEAIERERVRLDQREAGLRDVARGAICGFVTLLEPAARDEAVHALRALAPELEKRGVSLGSLGQGGRRIGGLS